MEIVEHIINIAVIGMSVSLGFLLGRVLTIGELMRKRKIVGKKGGVYTYTPKEENKDG